MREKTGFLTVIGIIVLFTALAVAAPPTHTISGVVATADGTGVEGVDIVGDNGAGSTTTAADGSYSIVVSNHWDGTITASKTGWLITPPANTYTKVSNDIPAQNYTAYQPKISGTVTKSDGTPLSGVTVTANNAGGSDTTDASGYYELYVPYNWSGTISATLAGYDFTDKSYTNTITDQTSQDFAGFQPTISGSTNVAGATVTISGVGVITSMPDYTVTVPYGWSGTITAELAGYDFTNSPLNYTNITTDQTNQNFTPFQPTISGSTGVAGATVTISGVGVITSTPDYTVTVPYGWSGTITAELAGYNFTNSPLSYTNVTTDLTSQNFTPFQPTISGSTSVAGATVTVSGVGSVVSTPEYSVTVPYGWSGTVETTLSGYHFPESPRNYSNVTADQTNQDFAPFQPTISGSTNVTGATVTISGIGVVTSTPDYTVTVPYGWSGTITAELAGYNFTNSPLSYTNVTTDLTNQNFTPFQPTISGSTSVAGATVTVSGVGSVVSTPEYSVTVPYGWSGTVETTLSGYHFPESPRSYTNVTANQTDQNFPPYQPTISGTIKKTDGTVLEGVSVTANNGGGSDTTDIAGYYEIVVPYGWSGQVTANKIKWNITPESYSYANLNSDQIDQDFSASYISMIIVKADGTGYVPTIQAAIDIAVDGDIVQVEDGTYTGVGNRDINFKGKAITVRGNVGEPSKVIIDGQNFYGGIIFKSGEGADSVLEGFTITRSVFTGYLYLYYPDYREYVGFAGGGIYCERTRPTIQFCIVKNNQAYYGGGICGHNGILRNCVISDNLARSGGGLFFCDAKIENCTIVNNSASVEGGGAALCDGQKRNSIFWKNSSPDGPQIYPQIQYSWQLPSYSCIQNWTDGGTGNISLNPLFAPDGYHLTFDSPCLDTGNPSTVYNLNNVDIDGNYRVVGKCIDMGADEFVAESASLMKIDFSDLEYVAEGIGSDISPQKIKLFNYGENSLNWQVQNICDWLAISPVNGQTDAGLPNEITVEIDPNFIRYGIQSCQFQIVDPNALHSPQTVTVTLNVLGPEMGVYPAAFSFTTGSIANPPAPQVVTISNTGFDTLRWAVAGAESCAWLTVSPESGQTGSGVSTDVTLSVDPAIAGYGLHSCQLTVSDPNAVNSPQVVTVTLDVLRPGIGVSYPNPTPAGLAFECEVDEPNVLTEVLSISNTGYDTLNWQIAEDCSWLSASPASGQCIAGPNELSEVTLTVDTAGLDIGFHDGQLTITDENASNSPVTVPVSLHIYRDGERHVPIEYAAIASAVSASVDGDHIVIHPGVYTGQANSYVYPNDRSITMRSVDPDDPEYIHSTIIGSGFYINSDISSGSLTIEGLSFIFSYENSSGINVWYVPIEINNCIFKGWPGGAIKLNAYNANVAIENCLFKGNRLAGIYLPFRTDDAVVEINNCTIVDTLPGYHDMGRNTPSVAGIQINGYSNNQFTIRNSILSNAVSEEDAEIAFPGSVYAREMNYISISNSCIPTGPNSIMIADPNYVDVTWGEGNVEADPQFISRGYLDDANTPANYYDDVWVDGDYHLKSEAGRFVWDGFARADFNWDKRVDLVDFSEIGRNWGLSIAGVPYGIPWNDCDLDGNLEVGLGDLTLFCDDYLQPRTFGAWVADDVTSPCIDAGDPADIRWQNELWPHGARINMGAYGGTAAASMSLNDVGNPADLNHDNAVDIADFSLWSGDWLAERVLLDSDFDRNNTVDPNDLSILINNWLVGVE